MPDRRPLPGSGQAAERAASFSIKRVPDRSVNSYG
jgi:hypothetical protein